MIDTIKIFKSKSLDPYYNLAIEKQLFDTVDENTCILYLWQNKNTVVIGANQNPWAECDVHLLESEGGKLVRRMSGGGAVFHDVGNVNFTFICVSDNYDLMRQFEVIKIACEMAGINAEISGRNDVLVNGRKFSGNAFYNSKGRSYHHGTLLVNASMDKMTRYLTPSKKKLEAKGVKSVASRVVNLSELCSDLDCEKMMDYMSQAFEKVYEKTAKPVENIDWNLVEKYSADFMNWECVFAKTHPFTMTVEERTNLGNVQLHLEVKEGVVKSVKTYTDSMDWTLPDTVSAALVGCKFTKNDIKKTLEAAKLSDIVCLFDKI